MFTVLQKEDMSFPHFPWKGNFKKIIQENKRFSLVAWRRNSTSCCSLGQFPATQDQHPQELQVRDGAATFAGAQLQSRQWEGLPYLTWQGKSGLKLCFVEIWTPRQALLWWKCIKINPFPCNTSVLTKYHFPQRSSFLKNSWQVLFTGLSSIRADICVCSWFLWGNLHFDSFMILTREKKILKECYFFF